MVVKRIEDDSEDSDEGPPPAKKFAQSASAKPTDVLTEGPVPTSSSSNQPHEKDTSVGLFGGNKKKLVLIKPKSSTVSKPDEKSSVSSNATSKNDNIAIEKPATPTIVQSSSSDSNEKPKEKCLGLGMLGAYGSGSSDSDSD